MKFKFLGRESCECDFGGTKTTIKNSFLKHKNCLKKICQVNNRKEHMIFWKISFAGTK